ncbi:hypothetical protein EBZ80_10480 [bacterium]|nr:hypothetical protein [bacterium]
MLSQIEVRTQDEQQLYDLLNEQFIWQLGTPSDEVDSAPEPEPTKAEAKPTKPDESRVATMLQQCMAILNEQSDQLNLLSGRIVEVEARQGIQLRP